MTLDISRSRRRWLQRWTWWGTRKLAAAVALYGCLFLLLTVGSMLAVTAGRQAAGVQIKSIKGIDGEYEIKGRARPSSWLMAGIRERVLGRTLSQPSGQFEMTVRSPFSLNGLSILVTDVKASQAPEAVKVPADKIPDSGVPLSIDVAYHILDAGLLWIAGRSDPGQVKIIAGDGSLLGTTNSDSRGIFDVLIPLAEPREQVSAARRALRSRPVPIMSLPAEGLPLARIAVLDLSVPKTKVSVKVVLPLSHPLFAAVSQGLLPSDQLMDKAFGFGFIPGIGPRQENAVAFEVGRGEGIVRLEWVIDQPEMAGFLIPAKDGIGSVPLLSPKDQVVLIFGRHRPDWLGETAPFEMTDRTATWRGPVRGKRPIVLEFGSAASSSWGRGGAFQPDRPGTVQDSAEELRAFLRSFESQVRAKLLQQGRRTVILLIPFIGFLLLSRRVQDGRPEVWRSLGAMALVLAIWRCWSVLYSMALAGPVPWINRVVLWLQDQGSEAPRSLEQVAQRLESTGPGAFWLLFVSLVALAPLYFDNVVRAARRWIPPARRRRGSLSRAWTALKGVAGTILLAGILLAVRPSPIPRDMNAIFAEIQYSLNVLGLFEDEAVLNAKGLYILALTCLFLVTFGLRGLLLGLVLLLANLHWMAQSPSFLEAFAEPYSEWLQALARLPASGLLLLCGLASLPAVSALLEKLVPFTPGQKRLRWLVAAGLATACLLLPDLPVRWILAVCGALLAVGFGWVVTRGLPRIPTRQRPVPWWVGPPSWTVAVLAVAGFAIGWPFPKLNEQLRLSNVERLMDELSQLFPWALALGVVLLLLDKARRRPRAILPKEVLWLGAYLYSIFLINSSATWLLVIPVPLLVGLTLAALWLFRPAAETSRLERMLITRRRNLRALLAHVLESVDSSNLLRAIRKSLTGKLEKAELEPTEYQRKLTVYRHYLEGKAVKPALSSSLSPRTLLFAVGNPSGRSNIRAAVWTGTLLALAPLSIALYQYLPNKKVIDPYPLAHLLVFLVGAVASWLLYAFFFGYFFAHLRGDSGLTKGIHLFSLMVAPFAVYRLLDTPTLVEMRPFLLWAAQVFLFCSLLGLIAFDYGLLRRNGFSAKDLRRVHDLPALSAYASIALAAIIPVGTAIVTDRLKELVSFFLNTILPRVPGP